MKCRGDVEELGIDAELFLAGLLSGEEIDAEGVVEEQIGGILPQDAGGLFREQGIGNGEGSRDST